MFLKGECEDGGYRCMFGGNCIDKSQLCDGNEDCMLKEDERCGKYPNVMTRIYHCLTMAEYLSFFLVSKPPLRHLIEQFYHIGTHNLING